MKRADADGSGDGDAALDQERVMIYSANWQLLEEYVDDEAPLGALHLLTAVVRTAPAGRR